MAVTMLVMQNDLLVNHSLHNYCTDSCQQNGNQLMTVYVSGDEAIKHERIKKQQG